MKEIVFDCYREMIPDFPLFLESLRQPLPIHLRVNKLKIEPQVLLQLLEKKGIYLKQAHQQFDDLYYALELSSPGNLLEYFLGFIHPQVLTSCIVPIDIQSYAVLVTESNPCGSVSVTYTTISE